jgi:Histidine phosphatase superfamily (branch 1)
VYVSPYRRTQQTAELICAELSPRPRPVLEERIREKEFGIFEGLTKHGSQARHPEEWARREKIGKYYYRPPVGESFPDVNLRVYSFLGTLIREHAGQLVLVVTHSVDFKGLKALADIAGRRFHRGLVLYLGRQAVAFGPICPGSDGDGAPRNEVCGMPVPVPVQREAGEWVVEEAARVLPVGASADVLVVGGGVAGLAAALAQLRRSASPKPRF